MNDDYDDDNLIDDEFVETSEELLDDENTEIEDLYDEDEEYDDYEDYDDEIDSDEEYSTERERRSREKKKSSDDENSDNSYHANRRNATNKNKPNKENNNVSNANETPQTNNPNKQRNLFNHNKNNSDKTNIPKKQNFKDKTNDLLNPMNKFKNSSKNAINNLKDGAKEEVSNATKSAAKSVGNATQNVGKTVGNGAKEAGKVVGQAASKAATGIGKAIGEVFAKLASSPHGLLALGIIAIVVFLIALIMIFFAGGNYGGSGRRIGLYGYDYYDSEYNCTNVVYNGREMSIDDYAAHVVSAEVGYYPFETQKVFAIAARSYVLQNKENIKINSDGSCYVEATGVAQAYNEEVTEENIQAAEETRGLVVTVNNIPIANYDESCVYTADEARELDPTGNFSNNYYYIRYGHDTIGGYNFQPIEYDKAEGINPLLNSISAAINGDPCKGNHGRGLSQSGSWYLERNENYTWEDIIDYYYQSKQEVKSLYHTYEVTSNWTEVIDTTAASSIPTVMLKTPINELMSENEYNDLNELIFDSVKAAGIGTRDAIVAAAVTPIKYLAENYGVTIPYTYGGGHNNYVPTVATGKNIDSSTSSYFGINPLWGTHVNANVDGKHSDYFGPDCSSWVPWVYTNAGIYLYPRKSYTFKDVVDSSDNHAMNGDFIATPGDLLVSNGHVALVVGVDTSTSNYYIAHARSQTIGVNITKESFTAGTFTIVDMTKYIESHQMGNYEDAFMNGVLSFK